MKKKSFLSLNFKILLLIFLVFFSMASVPLSVFLSAYVEQIEKEALMSRRKTESVWGMYEESRLLRQFIAHLYKTDSVEREEFLKGNREYFEKLLPKDSFLGVYGDLLSEKQSIKAREYKMEMVLYMLLLFLCLFSLLLIVLWVSLRRLVLEPLEYLLEGTNRLSNQDWGFRLNEKTGIEDELSQLVHNFNRMADSLEAKVNDLKKERLLLQNLLDALPDGVRVIDTDFNVVIANRVYQESCNDVSPLNKKCYFLRNGATENCYSEVCPIRLLSPEKTPLVRVIQTFKNKEGGEHFIEVAASTLMVEKDGEPCRYTVEVLRPLEHEISFSHQQKLSSLGVLSSSVAHEMRNPLGAMRLMLENLIDMINDKMPPTEDVIKYLTQVYNQMTACIEVTDRLLKLARKPSEKKEDVCLDDIVSQTASLMEYEAKKRGITLSVENRDDKQHFIKAIDSDLRMVALNIMQNAFDAMPNGGKMVVSLENKDSRNVTLCFSDTGQGMDKQVIKRIFEPFFSTKKTSDFDRRGTGLGLSIVKSIVESNKGRIAVSSVLGEGTTFELTFDRIEAD